MGAYLSLTGIALIYGRTGALNMAQISRYVSSHPTDGLVVIGFLLIITGLLVKGAIVCAVVGAVLLALTALYWRRLPVLHHGYQPGAGPTVVTRRFQSGVINDYVTWLVTGLACLGGVLALIIR